MIKVAEYSFNRIRVSFYSIGVGILIGLYNSYYPPIDFSLNFEFFGLLTAAVIAVVLLHEGMHGAMAVLFGLKPIFGLKLPLVYVTFTEKIQRGRFIVIALAPLIILNTIFGIFFATGLFKVFSYFCLFINTLGAVGDVWMTLKLLPYEKRALVQDTKTGIEIWITSPRSPNTG
jgi:hypothetical protein